MKRSNAKTYILPLGTVMSNRLSTAYLLLSYVFTASLIFTATWSSASRGSRRRGGVVTAGTCSSMGPARDNNTRVLGYGGDLCAAIETNDLSLDRLQRLAPTPDGRNIVYVGGTLRAIGRDPRDGRIRRQIEKVMLYDD